MKTKISAIALIALFTLGLASPVFAASEGDPDTFSLIAGQTIGVGSIEVYNDGSDVFITIIAYGGYGITETHVAVATNLADIPQTKKGNPIPGKFPYSGEHSLVSEVTYQIPHGGASAGTVWYVAVHAVVKGLPGGCYCGFEETAWGRPWCDTLPRDFPGKNWATYFTYTIT
jgi:hypothetical protein